MLTALEAGLADVLSFGLLGQAGPAGDPTRGLRVAIKRVCEALLPEAIGLSDGFGFTDWELDALLRRRAIENLLGSRETLQSIVRLVDQIEGMPVGADVRGDIQDALAALSEVLIPLGIISLLLS